MHVIFFRKKMEEMMGEWEQKSLLINELTQGRELARQLRAYLNVPSSNQTCELLVQQIQASYDKALSMLDYNHITTPFTAGAETQPSTVLAIGSPPPPFPPTQSPRDNGYYHPRDFREYNDRLNLDESMKRTTLPRWTQQVRLRPGAALEGPLDDGFSWRKYGQKDILGSKYPRWYYRCIHRHVRGCLATKQVQRSDEDPIMFEITYRGTHTCNNRPTNLVLPTAPSEIQEQQGTNIQPHDQHNQQPEENNSHQLITDEIIQAAGVVATDSTANATTGIGSNFPFANADFDPKLTFYNQGFFL